jgi:hypothetical protein
VHKNRSIATLPSIVVVPSHQPLAAANFIMTADGLKILHGSLMITAWLILAPIAIGSSLVRRCQDSTSCLNQNGFWFKIHFYSNCLVVLLTLVGFIVIWIAEEGGGSHDRRFLSGKSADDDDDGDVYKSMDGSFDQDGNAVVVFGLKESGAESVHKKIGISIVILAMFQAFLGFIRPHVEPHTASSNKADTGNNAHDDDNKNKHDDDVDSSIYSVSMESPETREAPEAAVEEDQAPPKTRIRRIWEWCHRFLGLSLLTSACVQCTIGIRLVLGD